jgi:hypothetical protein
VKCDEREEEEEESEKEDEENGEASPPCRYVGAGVHTGNSNAVNNRPAEVVLFGAHSGLGM